jgi:hypothetical protein
MTQYTPNFGLALPDFRQGPWHDQINSDLTKIDALLFSALSGANVAVWTNGTNYGEGETVVDDTDASIWLCAVEHTSAATPTTFAEDRLANPTYWTRLLTGFAPRGEWQNATNYFPYDLTFDSHLGIMALCSTKHTSIAVGNITDDEIYWAFLIDMSNADLSTAIAVTYDSTTSGLDADNVQEAIDVLETQILALNNVNITQGTSITNLQTKDTVHDNQITTLQGVNTDQNSRMTTIEAKNTTQDNLITALQNQVAAIPTSTFPVGTRMVFIQSAPPTGWTISGAYNDRAIRLVSGASGGTAGGSVGFATTFSRTATDGLGLAAAHLPPLTPPGPYNKVLGDGSAGWTDMAYNTYTEFAGVSYFKPLTGIGGNSTPHSHGMDMRLAYVDACVGVKS